MFRMSENDSSLIEPDIQKTPNYINAMGGKTKSTHSTVYSVGTLGLRDLHKFALGIESIHDGC